jgi:hypothetical protein
MAIEKVDNANTVFMTTAEMILSGNSYQKKKGVGYVFAGFNHFKNVSKWVWQEDE